ncbi:MAG: hypothetical protein HY782_08805 [Chloroflexi bacterium]|nr:hypothetical protein [Chloroflexota bacterium]
MTETTYIIDLTPGGENRYRHHHVLEKNKLVEFRLQYEAYLDGKWHAVARYDSFHGFAHRDVMHPDGTETKTVFQNWDYHQVLTFGERDLKQNWVTYRRAYERELNQWKQRRKDKR